ncbi:protein Star isoform X1 [Maniola jurtina]|uniref:protein Star isoform X1 n=1 Tax=Maniola jurtina TaxID=191418 RepID=UPI001E689376|nr:protein Star isoform X1 [Maniola jurtina]
MAEKKIQENPLPESQGPEVLETPQIPEPPTPQMQETSDKIKDVPTAIPVKITPPTPVTPSPVSRVSIPSFTKTAPNELYRKLLPAVLFLLTFVTVMTVLLIYMDTVALGAQQFRLNMSRDYELARIPAESPTLVAYVRQLHLAPRPPRTPPPTPTPTPRVEALDRILGEMYNGTLVEFLPRGGRDPTAAYLETVRGWSGVAVRAAPRDFLALRGAARALHACLSPTDHPREVSYEEAEGGGGVFRSRVLCLPLLTVLLAADAPRADYTALAGAAAPKALAALPYDRLRLKVIDFRSTDPIALNKTTEILTANNYTVAATFDDGIMYALKDLTHE